jgi:2-aminoadipate transaminase
MKESLDRLLRKRATAPNVLGLSGGLPAHIQFPRRQLVASFLRVIKDSDALQYGWPEGMPRLREQIAQRLQARGARLAAEDVLVTNGAQQAIAIAAQLACKAGDRIGVDRETYPSALDLFRSQGLSPVVDPSARVAYAMPAVGNPGGRTLTAEARYDLIARLDRIVIEDDAYAELSFSGPPGPPLMAEAPSRTLHIGTVSKTLCPGLRVGWLVVPPRYRTRARRLKQANDLQAGGLAQSVVSDFMAHDDLDRRLVRLRRFYRARCHRLLEALARHAPFWRFETPIGGFSVWVETDAEAAEEAFLAGALDEGVSFDPGSSFRPGETSSPLAFRLCYSATDVEQFDEAVRRLVRAWRRIQRPAWRTRAERSLSV